MRQFFESVLLFQLATCRLSPVHKVIPNRVEMTHEARLKKFFMYAAILLVLWIGQFYMFIASK